MIDRMDDAQFFEALNLPVDFRVMGAKDCERGFKERKGMPESYYLGYSQQYEREAQASAGESN